MVISKVHIAAHEGKWHYVMDEVWNGRVDINAKDEQGWSLLHCAASGGHEELVYKLLANDADPNATEPEENATPLHVAAFGGYKEVVEDLISEGANVKAVSSSGKTPEDVARERGHNDIVALIVDFDKSKID